MNCKPGDIAVVVHACEQQGRITRCLRLATKADAEQQGMFFPDGKRVWVVEHEFQYRFRRATLILDAYLRPIRNQPGADETLAWAGNPEAVGA